ncbi:acyl-CoA dehydrogenase [Roseomonas terrae]|uniref:Acyl-CoA dehydrogenase n=1 Tax=Neoroseomonas terrae TaxID=424799 RepID=A0ABS5EQB4_9PROT|nr:acyl-CoA dehydrogenase family protein [Neoroseomonas terrae]MBR0653182.1 acyl-CoA dehydrogenase [Neoroseomonas terrae]
MNDVTRMLEDTAARLFSDHVDRAVHAAAEAGEWPAALWQALEDSGLTQPLEAGLSLPEAMGLLQIAAQHAAPVPLAETLCAAWMMANCGIEVSTGPMTIAPVVRGETLRLERRGDGWHLAGRATRVPWGRHATSIAVLAETDDGALHVALLPRDAAAIIHGGNTALEPRDTLIVDTALPVGAVARCPFGYDVLRAFGAAMRTAQIAGALERALELSVTYAGQRVQFGRAIGKFQAIQHNLALLASQAGAAAAAAGMVAEALSATPDMLMIAAAKGRASEAASAGAAIAHQAHGAIGFTWEYPLNWATRRLWSWRDEFGNETEWYPLVGAVVAGREPAGIWPAMTGTEAA